MTVEVAEIKELIDEYTETLWLEVRGFVAPSKGKVWDDLRDIVRKAVRLDEELFKSRAIFVFGQWAPNEEALAAGGFNFDNNIMQSPIGFEDAEPDMRAEILLAPSLQKIGTSDGDGFDKKMYLEKWMVLCMESRLRRTSRR